MSRRGGKSKGRKSKGGKGRGDSGRKGPARSGEGSEPKAASSNASTTKTATDEKPELEPIPYDPSRLRVWPLFVILAAQAALIWLFYSFAGGNPPGPRLLAFDAIAKQGENVTLNVRVDRDLPPLLSADSEAVKITLEGVDDDGNPTGSETRETTAPLNSDVTFGWGPANEPGVTRVRVRAALENEDVVLEDEVAVHVMPTDAKIILTTVHTNLRIILPLEDEKGSDARPRTGSVEALRNLAPDHRIVYIGEYSRLDLSSTPGRTALGPWLAETGFPDGPLLFPDPVSKEAPLTTSARIEGLVKQELLRRWPKGVVAAIGSASRTDELRGFARAGIRTVSVGLVDENSEKIPGVENAQTWARVVDIIR